MGDPGLSGVSADQLAANANAAWGPGEIQLGELDNIRAIEVDGVNLNPDGYHLSNSNLRQSIRSLYSGLSDKLGSGNFEFQVTGGDRYLDANGMVRSSTNGKIIKSTGRAHLRGAAVDLRIKGLDGQSLDYKLIQPAANKAGLIYDLNALPTRYGDRHHHLQIPR